MLSKWIYGFEICHVFDQFLISEAKQKMSFVNCLPEVSIFKYSSHASRALKMRRKMIQFFLRIDQTRLQEGWLLTHLAIHNEASGEPGEESVIWLQLLRGDVQEDFLGLLCSLLFNNCLKIGWKVPDNLFESYLIIADRCFSLAVVKVKHVVIVVVALDAAKLCYLWHFIPCNNNKKLLLYPWKSCVMKILLTQVGNSVILTSDLVLKGWF